MKKILQISTITILLFFWVNNNTLALEWYSEGYIEKLLDINYWVEEYDLELISVKEVYFYTPEFKKMFEEFKKVDRVLKKEIITNYRNGNFDYYQANNIVSNYKNFVYHTNKLFYYVSIKESTPNFKETDTAILKNYRKMRSYYYRVKILVNNK